MTGKILATVMIALLLPTLARAQEPAAVFNDQMELAGMGHGVRFAEEEGTAQESLKQALDSLAAAMVADSEAGRTTSALNAWFWSVNGLGYVKDGKADAAIRKKLQSSLARAGELLHIPATRYNDYITLAAKYIKGLVPDNCGNNGRASLADSNLYRIIFDNGLGEPREFYFFKDDPGTEYCAGAGTYCFDIVRRAPVTPELKKRGINGTEMVFIKNCAGVN